jgi:hypothetical protein
LDARKEHERAVAVVKKLSVAVRTVGEALLTDPLRFMFSNLPIGLPPEASHGYGRKSVDARDWPSAEAIQNALLALHEAKAKAQQLWDRVPEADRGGLIAPER